MALLIRYDPKGGLLRSVGDPPHGVLVIACPDSGVTYAIDGSYDTPAVTPSERGKVTLHREDAQGGILPTSTPIDICDLIDACAGHDEIVLLCVGVAGAMRSAAEQNMAASAPVMVEYLQAHVDFVARLRSALDERGLLHKATDG